MTQKYDFLIKNFGIDEKLISLCNEAEAKIVSQYEEIDNIYEYNQLKVLHAMQKNRLSEGHFAATSGYGYNDIGRDVIEDIYADIFGAEAALVRGQMISGTHALNIALASNLGTGDELLSPVGTPYDTLLKVIGIKPTKGSLIDNGVKYKQVDLMPDGTFDLENIKKTITQKTKLVTIQRSKGYSLRPTLTIAQIKELISFIKGIKPDAICMVDNCYGEFTETMEPTEVGADMAVGSLIKNPGGGLAPVGGYIVGKKELIENAAIRLTAPGLGRGVGPSLGLNTAFAQGLFLAPSVVAGSLKGAIFAAALLEMLGFEVYPKATDKRSDIVQAILLEDEKNIVSFCRGVQKAAPVDSFVYPEPWDMPGYESKVIMAAGAFVQGSSIELSADAPIKSPFAVYLQGGLTFAHAKYGAIIAVNNMLKDGLLKL